MIRAALTAARALCALAVSACLAGCTAAAVELASASSGAPPPVTAAVDQFRDEYAAGSIVLQHTGTGSGRLSVVGAALADPRFEDGTDWTGSADLDPGQTTSLPATLAAARCTAATHDGGPSVRLRLADGTERTVPAADPHAVLPRLHDEQCFGEQCFDEQARKAVALRLDDVLAPGQPPGTAFLTLVADPTAAGTTPAPQATLVSVAGTTLLGEDPAHPWPRGVVLGAGSRLPLAASTVLRSAL